MSKLSTRQGLVTIVIGEGFSALHYADVLTGTAICGANTDREEEQFLARHSSGGGFCIHCAAEIR